MGDLSVVEETSDEGFPLGFPEVGTWNTTHNVAFNDMNLDARMVRRHGLLCKPNTQYDPRPTLAHSVAL